MIVFVHLIKNYLAECSQSRILTIPPCDRNGNILKNYENSFTEDKSMVNAVVELSTVFLETEFETESGEVKMGWVNSLQRFLKMGQK